MGVQALGSEAAMVLVIHGGPKDALHPSGNPGVEVAAKVAV